MIDQWKQCTSVHTGYQCTRQAGHVGRHHSGFHEWGSRDE